MYVLNLKKLRLPLLITAVLLAAWAMAAWPLSVALVSAYEGSQLLGGSWGDGPGQFGHGEDRLGKLQGPRSFVVDPKGNVLVGDTHNHRVVLFDSGGAAAGSGPVITLSAGDWLSHLAVDGKRHIYVAVGTDPRILCYDWQGVSLGQVDLAAGITAGSGEGEEWLLLGVWGEQAADWIGRGRAGLYAHLVRYGGGGSQAKIVHLTEPAGTVTEVLSYAGPGPGGPADGTILPETFCTGPRGQLAVGMRSGPFGLKVKVLTTNGRPAWEVDLSRQAVIAAAHLIGGDSRGGFYLALEYGSTAEVVRVTERGEPELVASVPPFRPRPDVAAGQAPYLTTPARVDRTGRVYLAVTSDAGFAIHRLKPQAALRRR